jgi:hypothetical protein
MADRVIEILRSKYLVSPIRYLGLQRVEELEYPEEALREAILNSIVHKDYTGAPIQMSRNIHHDLQTGILPNCFSRLDILRFGVVVLRKYLTPVSLPVCLNLLWKNMPEVFR